MPQPDITQLRIDRSTAVRRGRRAIRPVHAVAGVLVVGAALLWWGRASSPREVELVGVTTAYAYQTETLLNAAGYVVAQRKAAVASKATGRLEWLGVMEGSQVKAGDLIARLESKDVRAQADQARANVAVAKAAIEQAQAELQDADQAARRSRELVAKQFTSQAALDAAEARLAKARAAVSSSRAALSAAEAAARTAGVAVEQTEIRAPFDGVVLTKAANVGDTVTPFSNALDTKGAVVTMADMATLEVEADVSEANLGKIAVGQPCAIQLDAFPDKRLRGEVSRLVPTVDRSKATVMAKVKFTDKDARILPEMSAKVAFLSKAMEADPKSFTVVDPAALTERDGAKLLFLVAEGKAKAVPVQVGEKLGDAVRVTGVKSGDKVVQKPEARLKDGDALKVVAK